MSLVLSIHTGPSRIAALLVVSLAAGCATAPAPTSHTGHPAALTSATLSLCPGGNISNAPATNASGEISRSDVLFSIRNVLLTKAPVEDACLSSGFGPRRGGASNIHRGVDLFTRSPKPIYAAGDGVINKIGTARGYGNVVEISHANGVKTRYAHLSQFKHGLREGARVQPGAQLGMTGRTGNATAVHLHYEILADGVAVNPLGK